MTGTRDLAILTGGNQETEIREFQRQCKMGLAGLHERPSACFSLFHSLALTSISLTERPLLYEIRG